MKRKDIKGSKEIYYYRMYELIVLSGGGVKGIALVGGLKAIWEMEKEIDAYEGLKCIVGSSVGSLIGFLIVVGVRPDELGEWLMKINFEDYLRPEIELMLERYGLDDFGGMFSLINNFIREKLIGLGLEKDLSELTFRELYERTGKELIMTVSNLTRGRSEFWSYETTPEYKIIDGLRASMCFPVMFCPPRINGDLYIDGGALVPFPIRIIESKPEYENSRIGLFLGKDRVGQRKEFDNFFEYLMESVSIVYQRFSEIEYEKFRDYCCRISIEDVHPMEFDLSDEKKRELYETGYKIISKYLIPENSKK